MEIEEIFGKYIAKYLTFIPEFSKNFYDFERKKKWALIWARAQQILGALIPELLSAAHARAH